MSQKRVVCVHILLKIKQKMFKFISFDTLMYYTLIMDTLNHIRSNQKPNSNFPCPKIKKPEKNKRESIGRPKKLINSRNLKKESF